VSRGRIRWYEHIERKDKSEIRLGIGLQCFRGGGGVSERKGIGRKT